MSVEDRLRELGHTLPEPPTPKGVYVTAVEANGMLYTAGSSCFEEGRIKYEGKLGSDLTIEQGRDAAQCTMLNLLSVVKQQIDDLDKIERVVKVVGFIASAPGFGNQPEVLNGASELLGEVLGERGKHARSVVGVNELPMNTPIEIEMIVKVKG
jgi:enamine deaminase RidA (YjgF/YER057c/UK114 family)